MFMKMCNSPPWSHDALNTVHQRPRPSTGKAPLAQNSTRLNVFGDRMLNSDPPMNWPRDAMSVNTYMTTHRPITNGMNPMSLPNCLTAVAYPHNPGLRRPQL